jgi:hypothetical protein
MEEQLPLTLLQLPQQKVQLLLFPPVVALSTLVLANVSTKLLKAIHVKDNPAMPVLAIFNVLTMCAFVPQLNILQVQTIVNQKLSKDNHVKTNPVMHVQETFSVSPIYVIVSHHNFIWEMTNVQIK